MAVNFDNVTDKVLDDYWQRWMIDHRAKYMTAAWRKMWADDKAKFRRSTTQVRALPDTLELSGADSSEVDSLAPRRSDVPKDVS